MDLLVATAQANRNIHLHTRSHVTSLMQSSDEVTIIVNGERWQGSILVGADGIHSAVREAIFSEQKPRFTGNVAWRGLIDVASINRDNVNPAATVWLGPHRHFVHYYVRGGQLLNCVCVVEKSGWEVESWTEQGDISELKQDFHGWHDNVTELLDVMEPDNLFKWALFDRPPLPAWHQGRVVLIGDACHPTLPFMAQGAAMAIEDAAILCNLLSHKTDVPEALAAFTTNRLPRTSWIQNTSRRNAKIFHLSGPAAMARNIALAKAGTGIMDKLYQFDALTNV